MDIFHIKINTVEMFIKAVSVLVNEFQNIDLNINLGNGFRCISQYDIIVRYLTLSRKLFITPVNPYIMPPLAVLFERMEKTNFDKSLLDFIIWIYYNMDHFEFYRHEILYKDNVCFGIISEDIVKSKFSTKIYEYTNFVSLYHNHFDKFRCTKKFKISKMVNDRLITLMILIGIILPVELYHNIIFCIHIEIFKDMFKYI